MLKILRILSELVMLASVAVMLLGVFYLVTMSSDFTFPPVLVDTTQKLLDPLVVAIRKHFGTHHSVFRGHKLDTAYMTLILVTVGTFLTSLTVSAILAALDAKFQESFKYIIQLVKRLQKNQPIPPGKASDNGKTSWADKREHAAVIAVSMENLDRYPHLQSWFEQHVSRLSDTQCLYNHHSRCLIKLPSTVDAFQYALSFSNEFKSESKRGRVYVDQKPAYHIAVHTLFHPDELFQEESFIWALVGCVGSNQIYLSAQTKEQFDKQKLQTVVSNVIIQQVGTFSKLGDRTFPEIYRLEA